MSANIPCTVVCLSTPTRDPYAHFDSSFGYAPFTKVDFLVKHNEGSANHRELVNSFYMSFNNAVCKPFIEIVVNAYFALQCTRNIIMQLSAFNRI